MREGPLHEQGNAVRIAGGNFNIKQPRLQKINLLEFE